MALMFVAARAAQGFFRAGRRFTKEGCILDLEALGAEARRQIEDEPNLIVRPAREDEVMAPEPDDQVEARRAMIAEVIEALGAGHYGTSGKPKVEAINALLDGEAEPIDAAERDVVWAEMVGAGFEAPSDDARPRGGETISGGA
ncbi:MAG: hypothetical protein ACU0CO_01215 [Shimia sp.]